MKLELKQKTSLRRYIIPGISALAVVVATGLVIFFSSKPEDTKAASNVLGNPGEGVINAFAKVTSFDGATINLDYVNETYATFEAGEKVIVMQMQDSVIGANTNNDATFGDIDSIGSAGLYEVFTIESVNESGGEPTSITLKEAPTIDFNFTENSSVQVISFPYLGDSSGFSTTDDITTIDWDGNVGGVICFYVEGDLTLNHDIVADGAGFNGGEADRNSSSSGCNYTTYFKGSDGNYAAKGEGIYKSINPNFELGIGHLANGAGGGNSHNGGGGGGGNFTEGGHGGQGWNCNVESGGLGGEALSNYVSSSRVFLGGGGGAGEGNNNYAGAGGNGGGIILISAN